MSILYHYHTSLQTLNSLGLFQGQFCAIVETIDNVFCKTMVFPDPAISHIFSNDFIRARLFNQEYDIVVTPVSDDQHKAVILTEKTLPLDTKREHIVLNDYEICNFINKSPLQGKKYICMPNPDKTKVDENVSFLNEKYILYRLMEFKNDR